MNYAIYILQFSLWGLLVMSAQMENFESAKTEARPRPTFQYDAAEQRSALAGSLDGKGDPATQHLPSLVLVDQHAEQSNLPRMLAQEDTAPQHNLLEDGGWKMYNEMGKDAFTVDGDGTMHLSIDSQTKHEKDPGVADGVDLPPLPGPEAQAGQPVHVRFFAKSDHSDSLETDLMQSKSPFQQSINENVKLTAAWKEYDFDGVAPADGEGMALHFKTNGHVDIKQVSVTPETAQELGLNPNDLTPQGEQENIDRYRKGELKIEVIDTDGKPIPTADIQIHQTKQDFLFGTEVQALNPEDSSKEQARYQKALIDTFNSATVTPYWPQTQDNAEQPNNFDKFDNQIEWLQQNDMTVKAHPAFWPHFTPKWLPRDPDQAQPLIDGHTKDFVENVGRYPNVRFIENNEVAAAETDATDNGATNWVKKVGAPAAVEQQTAIEQKALPGEHPVQIIYNDYKENQQEIAMLDQLQKDGKLPDAIGIQMHMTQGNWPLDKVEHIVDELSKYGKPVYITEISVLSGEHRVGTEGSDAPAGSWPSTPEGEKEQAAYVQQLYKLLYSNPHVEGITWWDLTDKNSWMGAPRGLLRDDMSEKPAYQELHNLIKNQWQTEMHAVTNNSGQSDQRVFAGDYDITVTGANGKQAVKHAHIAEGGKQTEVVQMKADN